MLTLTIEMLGPLRVRVGGKTAVFRTDAERVLLAYLAAHQGRAQRRDTLAGLLAPDRPDVEALTYLRNRLTRLRDAVGDDTARPAWLEIDRKQITLRPGDDVEVDVAQFERLLAAVEGHSHRQLAGCPTCLAQLEEAVGLVRGEFLAGLNFASETWEGWLRGQREHVGQRALAAMTWLREVREVRGELTAVLPIAQRQLQLEPWLEAAHRAIMRAYYALGDRNAALAQFGQCQTVLWDELGVEPEAETVSLFESIKANGSVSSFIIPNSSFPNNLPLPTGPFFGREAEQAQLLRRLVDPAYRLITIVGTGGMGKTRLAVEVGRQVGASFPDGVWFVPLAGDAEQIKMAVGEAVGLGQGERQLTGEQVLALLRGKQLLLILDNCEGVVDELGFLVEWLRRAAGVAILATSREPLNLQAESVLLLDGLPVGVAERLFVQRGQMARADFGVTAVNLPQVQQICELVDGSPLGIGLAAAWVRRRSLGQIIAGIGQSLDFLATRLRDVDPRHRSVRAVLETSWQLLEPQEQAVLAALSVFPGSFTAVAAAQIAGATILELDVLCEKSLLVQQHERERYAMHSLVRQFAGGKLGERTGVVQRAFAGYFYEFAHDYADQYGVLQVEWGNLLTAVRLAHALQSWQLVLDLVRVLDEPWLRQIRLHEMREGLGRAVEAATMLHDEPTLARLLLRLGQVEMELNGYGAAAGHLAAAMERLMRLEDSVGIAEVNYLYGRIQSEQGRDDEALALFIASRCMFAQENHWLGIAKNLNLMAVYEFKNRGDFQAARRYLEEAAGLQRPLPLSATYVETLRYLGRVHSILEAYEVAERYLGEAAEAGLQQGDVGEYSAVLYERLLLGKKRGQVEEALAVGYACLESFRQLGSLRWEGLVKTQLALLHQAKQELDQAVALFMEGLHIFQELGEPFEEAYSYYYLAKLYAERDEAGESFRAGEAARRLNLELKNPRLAERLQSLVVGG